MGYTTWREMFLNGAGIQLERHLDPATSSTEAVGLIRQFRRGAAIIRVGQLPPPQATVGSGVSGDTSSEWPDALLLTPQKGAHRVSKLVMNVKMQLMMNGRMSAAVAGWLFTRASHDEIFRN